MRKYIVLAVAAVIVYFFHTFFLAAGGVAADSLSYFGIASDFPRLETNLFPLGYPVMLRLFHFIFQDYFWASKMLNFVMMSVILVFSYSRKFYFRETVLLFTGKTLFFVFNYAISEGPFIFLLYFLFYIFHQRFHEKIDHKKFIVWASFILILLFTVRYSGIYIYLGSGLFWLFMVLNKEISPIKKDFFKVLLISGLGIASYLIFNYSVYGSFTGEDLRGAPEMYHTVYILRDLLGMTNVVNPFIGLKPASNSLVSILFQVGLMLFDFFVLWRMLLLFKSRKNHLNARFHYYLWTVAAFYTVTLFFSGIVQQIEEMNVRMLAAANFLLFFSFLLIYFKNLKSDRLIFTVGCFFLVFLTAYSLKNYRNYFKARNQIEAQMPKFAHKKYFYNDDRGGRESLTTYKIPFTNRTFQYKHTNNQVGDTKQNIGGTVNPQIKWLKYDTIKDKSQVLYTSELLLKDFR